jgi:hypothetical protein
LRVPRVALRAEEGGRRFAGRRRRPPLDQLVEGAHRETDRRDQEEEPLPGPERRPTEEDLPGEDRRDEALHEVAEAVVVVAGETEGVPHPEAERDLGVGVVSARHQDDRVEEEEAVEKGRQAEPPVGRDEQRHADEDRRHLEHPGEAVVRRDARQREERDREAEEDGRLPVAHVVASHAT